MPSTTIRFQGEMHSMHIEKIVYYIKSLTMSTLLEVKC